MIKEAYCSYEISKLLKEKGFDEECTHYFTYEDDELIEYTNGVYSRNSKDCHRCTSPTHQMATAWLREEYDLHIIVYPYKANDKKKWCCQIFEKYNSFGCEKYVNETLDSYEEAVETAIKYSLEKLI